MSLLPALAHEGCARVVNREGEFDENDHFGAQDQQHVRWSAGEEQLRALAVNLEIERERECRRRLARSSSAIGLA
jgi:hypothetical protein